MPFILYNITSCEGGTYHPSWQESFSLLDICASFQKGSYFLNKVFSFYPRGSLFLCGHIPVWCPHCYICAFREGNWQGPPPTALKSLFGLPCHSPVLPCPWVAPILVFWLQICLRGGSAFVSPHLLSFHFHFRPQAFYMQMSPPAFSLHC